MMSQPERVAGGQAARSCCSNAARIPGPVPAPVGRRPAEPRRRRGTGCGSGARSPMPLKAPLLAVRGGSRSEPCRRAAAPRARSRRPTRSDRHRRREAGQQRHLPAARRSRTISSTPPIRPRGAGYRSAACAMQGALRRCPRAGQPFAQQDDVVGDPLDVRHDVRGDQDRGPDLVTPSISSGGTRGRRVDRAGERLVEQEQPRALSQRDGEGEASSLAGRERRDAAVRDRRGSGPSEGRVPAALVVGQNRASRRP